MMMVIIYQFGVKGLKNKRRNITEPLVWNNNKIYMCVGLSDEKRVIEVFLSSKNSENMGRLFVDVGILISKSLRSETIEKLATDFPFETPLDAAGKRKMNNETIITVVIRKLNDINEEFKQKDGK